MQNSLLPSKRDLANTAVSMAIGATAAAILAVEQRRAPKTSPHTSDRLPDDPAWHAAVAAGRV